MRSILTILHLTDHYERKARLLPALLSFLVVLPPIAAASSNVVTKLVGISTGGVLFAIIGVGLAYLASAAGRHYEKKLWPNWPFDAPTNRWLHPNDTHCSREQKELWYKAIKLQTGLDIAQAAAQEDEANLDRVINDAVRALRNRFRQTGPVGLLPIHNVDYGFARNLAGLRAFWFPASIASVGVTWGLYLTTQSGLLWGVIASLVLLICLWALRSLPEFVRQRADRYAESFFGALEELSIHLSREHSSDKGGHAGNP